MLRLLYQKASASLRRMTPFMLLLLLYGCSNASTITVQGSYPSPLVSKLPLTAGVYYDEAFSAHRFVEINEMNGRDQYIINSGASQVELFNTILPALFNEVVIIEDRSDIENHPGLDVIFMPRIDEFQLGLPEKTRLDVYEVWIKYNMRLANGNGDYIADWVMTAYGKSPRTSFGSARVGVNEAAVIALRDLAASFSLGFRNIPEVNQWLRENNLIAER